MKSLVFAVLLAVAPEAEPGFWQREWMATKRIATAPVTLAWGAWDTCKNLTVGMAEILTGCRFKRCTYPMDKFQGEDKRNEEGMLESRSGAMEILDLKNDARIKTLCRIEDWEQAAELCRKRFSSCKSDVGLVSYGTTLAMFRWNAGDRFGAVIAMDVVIAACTRLGEGREKPAVDFRNDLRRGKIARKFSAEEALELVGIRMSIVSAALK